MTRAILLCALLIPSALLAERVHEDISLVETEDALTFSNAAVELSLDTHTGAWRQLRDVASGRLLMVAPDGASDFDLKLDAKWLSADSLAAWRYAGKRVARDGDSVALEVDCATDGWRATVTYRLWPGRPVLSRGLALEPTGDPQGTVRGVRFVMHQVQVGGAEDTRYSILANWPPRETSFTDLQLDSEVPEFHGGAGAGFVVTHSADAGLGIVAACVCETERARATVVEGEDAIRIVHDISAQYRPAAGKREQFGSQLIAVTDGDWRKTLRDGRDLYDLVGLVPPADMMAEAQRTVFYSAHVGGTIDSGFRDVGGFTEFAKYLPELQRLGVTELWLLPFWKGFVYAPTDYYSLDENMAGTEEELKTLVDQAHALGMRVLGDLIPHGPRDSSGLHIEHRDWISTMEDGGMQYWWGCLSCDYAHPGWQGYMADHAVDWVRRVGLDGYRVDCAGGGPYNWAPAGDNRPSMSGMHGGVQVLRAAREKMHEEKEQVLLLAEADGPPLLRYADYAYDWTLCWDILKRLPKARVDEFIPDLAQWLENEQYWLPKNAKLIKFLENHDSVRARAVHGPGMERALMAMCATIPGTPFVYHFQEIGMAPYLTRLYYLRRTLPELMSGDADFLSVTCDQRDVMVFTRTLGEQTSLIAINFTGENRDCTLTLPADLSRFSARCWDALRGRPNGERADAPASPLGDGKIALALRPYEAAVILDGPRGVTPAPEPATPEPVPATEPTVTADEDRVTVDNGALKVIINKQRGGMLESVERSDGRDIARVLSLEEGKRRLWLGTRRLSLGEGPADSVTWRTDGDAVTMVAQGSIARQTPGGAQPVMDYAITYRIEDSPALSVRYELTAREPIDKVLGSLCETLRLDPDATEWMIPTLEGPLHDRVMSRRPRDFAWDGRYWRGTGNRVWQSKDVPLNPDAPDIWFQGEPGRWVRLRVDPAGAVADNVMLKMRLDETVGPHVVFEWLDGTRPVSLAASETLRFGYALDLQDGIDPATVPRPVRIEKGPCTMRARGSQYLISNGRYDLSVSRYGGGRLGDLRLTGDAEGLISDSKLYTDGGIYDDRTTPDMQTVRNFVTNLDDPETEVSVVSGEGAWQLRFDGYLRTNDGCGTASPRTRYRVTYGMDASDTLRVNLGLKTHATIPEAKAFLAQTLDLPRFGSYEVNAKDGLATGTPPARSWRVWESKAAGFADEPWMVVRTGTGRALRFAGPDLARVFQNAFLFRTGGTEGVVFLALNDFEPQDIDPVWREAEYTITPSREAE